MSYQKIDTHVWHDRYFEAEAGEEDARFEARVADEAYAAARQAIIANGLPVSNTDLAEEVVAVLYRYIVMSKQAA